MVWHGSLQKRDHVIQFAFIRKEEKETREFYLRLSLVLMMLLTISLLCYGKVRMLPLQLLHHHDNHNTQLVQLKRKFTLLLPRRYRENMEC